MRAYELNPKQRFAIKSVWTVLFDSERTVSFIHLNGKVKKIEDGGELIIKVLDTINSAPINLISLNKKFPHINEKELINAIYKLMDEDIIGIYLDDSIPSWLSKEEFNRFKHQIDWFYNFSAAKENVFKLFKKIRQGHVTLFGCGSTNSILAMLLTSIGVGKLTLIDGDSVEDTNLTRQIFYTEEDVESKRNKAVALSKRIQNLSKFTKCYVAPNFCHSEKDLKNIINPETSYLIASADIPKGKIYSLLNSYCLENNVVYSFLLSGIIAPLCMPGKSACFECLNTYFKKDNPNFKELQNRINSNKIKIPPAFVGEMISPVEIQFYDCIGFLTNAWRPRSLNNVLFLNQYSVDCKNVSINKQCRSCSNYQRFST